VAVTKVSKIASQNGTPLCTKNQKCDAGGGPGVAKGVDRDAEEGDRDAEGGDRDEEGRKSRRGRGRLGARK
jgi:hypothetical protein